MTLCFCACASGHRIENVKLVNTQKDKPVFMNDGQKRTVLKMSFDINKKNYNFLLLATKKENYINFKIFGDFASVISSVNLRGGNFDYEIIPPFSTDEITQALEEILLTLFEKNADLIKQSEKVAVYKQGALKQKYYFNEGDNLPYKLKQTSPLANKTFLFENYKDGVPQNITVKAKFNLIEINFDLLAHD